MHSLEKALGTMLGNAVETVLLEFSELKIHAVFTKKASNFLANMTENSRQVILPREMV